MNWNWDPDHWKRSTKVWLGIATIWPIIYMGLFITTIFSIMLLMPFAQDRSTGNCGSLDLIELTHKIQNGELKQLTLRRDQIVSKDRVGNCEYETWATNESTRAEILREARELDTNGHQRVAEIDENTVKPRTSIAFSLGFMGIFGLHLVTILLMMVLLPFYLILAVKNEHLDQTMRIIWVVLFCTLGLLANPVYWFLYVWRKPSATMPPETVSI